MKKLPLPRKLRLQLLDEYRKRLSAEEERKRIQKKMEASGGRPWRKRHNRDRNKPCPCLSGKKFKRCCW
jgi:uncharacterized protein YecA (UPF0149 family)